MTRQEVFEGQRVLIECTFRLAGVPTDPVVVQFTTKRPDTGDITVLTFPATNLTRREQGVFEASVTVDSGGMWWFRFEGAGIVDAVTEIPLSVTASVMN